MTDEREPRDDPRFEEFLERHAREYHPPPETPRQAMWEAIEARRRERDDVSRDDVIPLADRRRVRWIAWTAAAAAVLILGIGLGRLSTRQGGEATRPGPAVATAPDTTADPGASPEALETDDRPTVEPGLDRDAPGADPRVAAADPRAPAPARRARDGRDDAPDSSARDLYRLASTQMLAQAETILVQYRADRRSARIDPAVGRWAKDVLTSTRLLLDSPAADDPGMRRLLEDLELVLAQIVHVSGVSEPGDEAEWLDRTIEDRDMIPRLRMAIPEGDAATVGL